MCPTHNEPKQPRQALVRVLPLCLLGLLAACGSDTSDVVMERRAQTNIGRPDWKGVSASSEERFGPRQAAPTGSGHGANPQGPGFVYDLPEGWTKAAPTDLRMLNLKVAGRDDAACYLTALPGKAGGILDNVNRWRSQFGAAPIAQADIAGMPTTELFALQALRVEVTGPYSDGMGGGELSEGSLVGLIVQQDDTMVFLKMVGPKDVIAQETAHFDEFVRSLTFPGAPNKTDVSEAEKARAARTMTHVAPEGWTVQGPKPMRKLGYDLPGGVDLGVTVLGGAAGGVAANVNRWRGQLGLSAVSEADLMAGDRIDCFGVSSYWVKFSGSYSGMSGESKGTQDTMMAVVVPLEDETIFIKCVGSVEAMQDLEPALREFVASLKWETTQ